MLKGKTPDVLEALFVLFVLLFGAGAGVVGGFIGYEIGKRDEPPAAVAPLVDSGPATAAPTTTAAAGSTTDETTAGEATTSAATSTPGDAAAGEQVFAGASCGSCHTLAAAGAAGLVGPNLDQTKPSFAQVVNIVSNGGGAMPAFSDRLSKSQIADLAAFVTQAVGGGTPTETGQGGTSGATTTKPVELVLKEGRLTGGLRFVPAGRTTFSVRNAGGAGNWFAVLRADTSRLVFLGKLANIRPGQRRSLTLTLSKGTYLLACCSQPGKLERGMFSTVKVSS